MKPEEELLKRIVVNPKVMGGKPIVAGTRITVEQVLKLLAQGLTAKDILKDYPHLTKEDIKVVIEYAGKIMENEEACGKAKDKNCICSYLNSRIQL